MHWVYWQAEEILCLETHARIGHDDNGRAVWISEEVQYRLHVDFNVIIRDLTRDGSLIKP